MSTKRLKRRIHELCGLESLSKDERVKKASEILSDSAAKQAICHEIVGASHRDIEKALGEIIAGKKRSRSEETYRELEDEVPEKINPEKELKFLEQRHAEHLEPIMNQAEVNWLIQESLSPKEDPGEVVVADPTTFNTYSFEEVAALQDGNYHPSMFKYRNR